MSWAPASATIGSAPIPEITGICCGSILLHAPERRAAAAARPVRCLGPRDGRAAFLAAGAALVPAVARVRARHRGAGAAAGWLGIVQAGREVAVAAQIPGWSAAASTGANAAGRGNRGNARPYRRLSDRVLCRLACRRRCSAAASARLWQRRRGTIRIGYPSGQSVNVMPGTSVLEASRLGGIPHASICGGRGRCSTCRVQVRGQPGSVPPPRDDEQRVLNRIRAIGSSPPRLPAPPDRSGRSRSAAAAFVCRPGALRCPPISRPAASATSRCCSPICAASRRCRKGGCPTMSSLC